ncbi:MAG: HAD family hydrolase [Deltaproteobacteria bacterium]|jgi:phosphoglycolate phosphatase|nr:HAD family hydrolase [Deltaproteobacteria bacterium]
MLTTLIFDIDLTLVNTLDACLEGTNLLAKEFNLEKKTSKEVQAAISLPLESFWHAMWGKIEPEWYDFYIEKILPNINLFGPLYPGVLDILKEARDREILLAISTNRYHPWLDLAKIGIAHLFDTAVGPDQNIRPKPEPDIPQLILKQLGSNPSTTIYVGDSTFDMLAANASGIKAMGLTQGGTSEKDLFAAGAWLVKPSILDVRELLDPSRGFLAI